MAKITDKKQLRNKNEAMKRDGWGNLFTGMGIMNKDKRLSTQFFRDSTLTENALSSIYRFNGLGRRIIDLPVNEMIREWFEIEGDPDGLILQALDSISAKENIKKMLTWAKLFGGSVGVILCDDGQELAMPLSINTLRRVAGINVFDRHRISWNQNDLYSDPKLAKYNTPEFYTIRSLAGTESFRVHETRTIRIDGSILTDSEISKNNGWYDSELQVVYESLRSIGSIYSNTEIITEDFVLGVLSIEGLSSIIATGNTKVIQDYLSILDMSRHAINTMLLDVNEKYEKKASSVAGLAEVIDRFILMISATTGIPATLLMGQAPAGLNATGDADIRNWYDKIASMQEEKLGNSIRKLIELIQLSKEGPTKGKLLEKWSIKWNPLWQLTQKEEAELRRIMAETDRIYIESGVLSESEVAESRFGGNKWSMETVLDKTERSADDQLSKAAASGEIS